MPGAPPTSTREPLTAPPPSTRSSSPIPVEKRSSSVVSISRMALGRLTATPRAELRPAAIRRAGYDLDLVDDDILETLDPAAYPLVVLPRVTRLPAAAAAWLDRVRAAGGTVLAVESPAYPAGIAVSMPETLVDAERLADHATLSMAGALPTAHDGDATFAAGGAAGPAASDGGGANPLAAALDAVALPPMLLEGDRGQVGVVCRRLVDGELFLLVNTGPTPLELSLAPRRPRAGLSVHDPATGARQALDPAGGSLALAPYESRLLLAHDEALADLHDAAPPRTVARPLDGPWSVAREGEEPRPVTLPHLLVGTEAADLRPLVLETTVTLDEREAAGPLLLDLGEGTPHEELGAGSGYRALLDAPVREVAIVEIDGHRAGMLWSPPYRLDLTGRISAGTSRLTLRVLGTTAPAAAAPENAMPAARDVAVAHATYGERFQPQELDLLLDGVATGLAAVPVLHLPAR